MKYCQIPRCDRLSLQFYRAIADIETLTAAIDIESVLAEQRKYFSCCEGDRNLGRGG
ncbi:MAG: hypothetical protein V7K53_14225 [Nostoc sp.]|uniref:hypothetical protein n=1 Tax=Nostoc sp. TaxID=1180 RepID=UPI002FF9F331